MNKKSNISARKLKQIIFLAKDFSTVGGIPGRVRNTVLGAQGREVEYLCISVENINNLSLENFYSINQCKEKVYEIISKIETGTAVFITANTILRDFPEELQRLIKSHPIIHMHSGQMAFFIQDSVALSDRAFFDDYRASAVISLSDDDINFQKQLGLHNQIKGFLPVSTRRHNTFEIEKNRFPGYVGRIDFHAKDCARLLDVALAFKNLNLPPLSIFTTAGKNSPDYNKFIKQIEKNNLGDQFNITLECTDKDEIYRNLSFLILPSKKESFGNVILEAYSYGIPVIGASYAPGPAELIENGRTGFLLDNFIGEEVAKLLANTQYNDLQRMSAQAFKKHKKYSLEAYLSFTERLSNEISANFVENKNKVFPDLKLFSVIGVPHSNNKKTKSTNPSLSKGTIPEKTLSASATSRINDIGTLAKLSRSIFSGFSVNQLESLKLSSATAKADMHLAAWHLAKKYAGDGNYARALENYNTAKQGSSKIFGDLSFRLYEIDLLRRAGRKSDALAVATELHMEMGDEARLCYMMSALQERVEERLDWINKPLLHNGLTPVTLRDRRSSITIYDIDSASTPIEEDHKISVIIPAFNAEKTIRMAVNSIIRQTWKNIQIIIVDDASTDDTWNIAKDIEKSDPRIIAIRQPENRGAYQARNLGLRNAVGEFVTINDADDWSHPQRLEFQIREALKGRELNCVHGARLTETLHPVIKRYYTNFIMQNTSSILYDRLNLLEIGGWDNVRFSSDTELSKRYEKKFGTKVHEISKYIPLTLILSRDESLTNSGATGLKSLEYGARREYREASSYWHSVSRDLVIEPDTRPFPVPRILLERTETPVKLDLLIVSDFSHTSASNIRMIEKVLDRGCAFGVFHLPRVENFGTDICQSVRKIIHERRIQTVVSGENVICESVIILDPSVLLALPDILPRIEGKCSVMSLDTEAGSDTKAILENAAALCQPVVNVETFEHMIQLVERSDISPASGGMHFRKIADRSLDAFKDGAFPSRLRSAAEFDPIAKLGAEIKAIEARRNARKNTSGA